MEELAIIAVSHGTADAAGQAAIARLREAIGKALQAAVREAGRGEPQVRVGAERGVGAESDAAGRAGVGGAGRRVVIYEAYVDVQEPSIEDVAREHPGALVLPLFLSTGFHVKHDIGEAARRHGCSVAEPLGPDTRFARLLARQLSAGDCAAVLAAAGSSDRSAQAAVAEQARQVAEALGESRTAVPVTVAYGSIAQPSIAAELARVREDRAEPLAGTPGGETGRAAVLSYLLAPGYFYDQLRAAVGAANAAVQPEQGDGWAWYTQPLLNTTDGFATTVEVAMDRALLWAV